MGATRDAIRARVEVDRFRFQETGIVITDEEFKALEAEIDGRHTTDGSWENALPEASLYSCALLDMEGRQRIWPKAPPRFWVFCPGCGRKHRIRKPRYKGWLYCGPCVYYMSREEYFAPVPEGVDLRRFP